MSTLSVSSNGVSAQVSLDGTDISHALQGLTMRYDACGVPTAVLDVVLFQRSDVGAEDVAVTVPESTAELLVQLGWTPPATGPLDAPGEAVSR